MPKVSILIPTYNYAWALPFAIESILSQTYQDWELIITDDCSSDNTAEVVQKYLSQDPRISFYINEKNLGLYGNFNNARHYAKGEYLLFLCADDGLNEVALEKMVKDLEANPTAALATTYERQSIDQFGNKGGIIYKQLGPGLVKGQEVLLAQCRYAGSVGRPSEVLIRAKSLPPGDTFDRSVEHVADNYLWCKLCEKWDIVYSKGAKSYIRFHKKQATEYHKKILLDIQHVHDMFVILFKENYLLSKTLKLKWLFVKNRLYPWFDRALIEAFHGEFKRSLWILDKISSFSKFPWWFPYFVVKKFANIFSTIAKR